MEIKEIIADYSPFAVILFLLLAILFVVLWLLEKKKNRQLRVENSIYDLNIHQEEVNFSKIFEVYSELSKYNGNEIQKFIKFSEQVLIENILRINEFQKLSSIFFGWVDIRNSHFIVQLYISVCRNTKDHVRNLAHEYLKKLEEEKTDNNDLPVRQFKNEIEKDHFDGYSLKEFFFRQTEIYDVYETLGSKRKSK